jgi:hypothetical protein
MKKMILLSMIALSTFMASAQCSANFSWTVNGSTAQFTNTSSGTNYATWDFGDGTTAGSYDANHSYAFPGTYTVCLTASYVDSVGGSCFDSICQFVTVFQDSSGGGGTGCSINASIYGDNSSGQIIGINGSMGSTSFTWDVYDNFSGAFLTSVSTTNLNYSPGYLGDFYVCLTAYDDSTGMPCDSLCNQVSLIADSLDSNANVINQQLMDFALFPNPTNAVLFLQLDQFPGKAHAHIVDLLGREMIEVDLRTQLTEIHVADLPGGVYIVQLLDASNQVIGTRKFIRN